MEDKILGAKEASVPIMLRYEADTFMWLDGVHRRDLGENLTSKG